MGYLTNPEQIQKDMVRKISEFTTVEELAAFIGQGLPVGVKFPWSLSEASIPAGWIPENGQLLSRAVWPKLWALYSAQAVTDAYWIANPLSRGQPSAGDGSTTFRMPDTNGKHPDGLTPAAAILRGYGKNSAGTPGLFQLDQFQGHAHDTKSVIGAYTGNSSTGDGLGNATNTITNRPDPVYKWIAGAITDGTNGVPRVGSETRPTTVTVIWCTAGASVAVNPGSVDVVALATAVSSQASKIQTLEAQIPKKWVSDWRTLASNVTSTFAHNMHVTPSSYMWEARMKVATAGYAAGEVLTIYPEAEVNYAVGMTIFEDGMDQFKVQTTSGVNVTVLHAKGTGTSTYLPWANCDVRCTVVSI